MPIQLLRGNELIKTENVASFVNRATSDWALAKEILQMSVGLQQKYYDHKHRDVGFKVRDLVLLSTRNLKMKGTPGKLQRKFVEPFQVIESIGQQAYRLSLPDDWKIHPVFHVSLLKKWNTVNLHEDLPVTQDDIPDVDEPYYEIEKILSWGKVKRNNKILKEYLVLWKGYPIEDSIWIQAQQFSHTRQLQEYLKKDKPQEEKM